MEDSSEQKLKEKIEDLEKQLGLRDEDLKNYRDELKQANSRMENLFIKISQDIKALERLQASLVPKEFPHIQGFEFSNKFVPSAVSGGDFLDVFEHQDKLRFSMVMSSSSGYGLSALMLSSLLNLSGLMATKKARTPSAVVKAVVGEIQELIAQEDEADFYFSMVNRRTLELQYCLAGGILGFYLPAGTKDVEPLVATNDKIFSGSKPSLFQSRKIQLSAKDRLIICSRGVIQAKNLNDDPFSLERLIKVLINHKYEDVHKLRNEIFFQLKQHMEGANPPRDQSVMILEVKEQVLKLMT